MGFLSRFLPKAEPPSPVVRGVLARHRRRSAADAYAATRQQFAASSVAYTSRVERGLRTFVGREVASERVENSLVYLDGEIPHPSKILDLFSEEDHRLGELWDDMLDKDAALRGLWEKRVKAVISLPWRVDPQDSTQLAVRTRDFASFMLDEIPAFDEVLKHQMYGILKGLAIDEIIPIQPDAGPRLLRGRIVAGDVIDRPLHRFGFQRNRQTSRWRLRVRDGYYGLKAVPEARFLCMRTGSKDNPWGGSMLIDSAYWLYYLGKNGWKSFAVALEKWGQPTLVGRYPSEVATLEDSDEEIDAYDQDLVDRILLMLQTVQTDNAIVIPLDAEIDTLEAKRGGSVHYPGFIQLAERGKALLLLGELDTSGVAQDAGSFAKARVSNEVRLETVRHDARKISEQITRYLIAPFVRLNFGPNAPVPRFTIESLEAEDRVRRQAGAEVMLDRGQPLILSDYYALYQQRMPGPEDETIGGEDTKPQPPAPPEPPEEDSEAPSEPLDDTETETETDTEEEDRE